MPEEIVVKKVVALYGSLRKDGSDFKKLSGKKPTLLSQKRIEGYKLYDMAGKAAVMAGTPEDSILVDIFRVGPQGEEVIKAAYAENFEVKVLNVDGIEGDVVLMVYNGPLSEHAAIITSGDWNGYVASRPRAAGDEEAPAGDEEEEEEEPAEGDTVAIADVDTESIADNIITGDIGNHDHDDAQKAFEILADATVEDIVTAVLDQLNDMYDITIKEKAE